MKHPKANALINARLGEAYSFTTPMSPRAYAALKSLSDLAAEWIADIRSGDYDYLGSGTLDDAYELMTDTMYDLPKEAQRDGKRIVALLNVMITGSDKTAYWTNTGFRTIKQIKKIADSILMNHPVQPQGRLFGEGRIQEMRAISTIANEIKKIWGSKVNYAAKPYLDAMFSLEQASDDYGMDSGTSIIAYFLSNASSFRGPDAKRLKDELKAWLKKPNSPISERKITERGLERPNDMVHSYLEAMLWAETNYNGDPEDDNYDRSFDQDGYTVRDVEPRSRKQAESDCKKFIHMAALSGIDVYDEEQMDGNRLGDIGMDFWLTRQGHGAGFWDGDFPTHGDTLTQIAKKFREMYPLVSGGKVYIERG